MGAYTPFRDLLTLGRHQPLYFRFTRLQGPVFLVNSRLASFAAGGTLRCRQSLSRSYGRFIAEFLNASFPEHLGLLDLSTSVGLRYGLIRPSVAMIFLETEGEGLTPLAGSIWGKSSALSADFPTEINALLLPRAVNAHAPFLPFRPTAPRRKFSCPEDVSMQSTDRDLRGSRTTTLGGSDEVQEY